MSVNLSSGLTEQIDKSSFIHVLWNAIEMQNSEPAISNVRNPQAIHVVR